MHNKAYVKPSKAASVVQIVVATLFLPFGIVLCLSAEGEARMFAMIFMVIWIAACGSIIVYGLLVLFSRKPPAMTEIDIESLDISQPVAGMDFETKLKKLESLRQERLINEEEYRRKRSEIMKEKW